MAEVIQLTRRRSAGSASPSSAVEPTTVYFDLALPSTYLVAERVERRFGGACWRPATLWEGAGPEEDGAAAMTAAERRARELRLPLVWPDRHPATTPAAMRLATYAAERGCGAAFAVAAGRLAFCGGFDIEEPDMLAEAAAAAGLDVAAALDAAGDLRRDEQIVATGRELWAQGGTQLPAMRVERQLYCGEQRITVALARTTTLARPFAS